MQEIATEVTLKLLFKRLMENEGIFTACFEKKDGTVREMNCRFGVTKHLKGGVNTCAHIPTVATVFDMQKQEYRNITVSKLFWIKHNGKRIDFRPIPAGAVYSS
jgi:WYL domain-containing protein